MIGQIKLDESTKLEFDISITGASGIPESRFIIDAPNFSIMYKCACTNEKAEVEISGLNGVIKSGEYPARLEVVLENKIYTPLRDTIKILPIVEVTIKAKPITIEPELKTYQEIAKTESQVVGRINVMQRLIDEKVLQGTESDIPATHSPINESKNSIKKIIVQQSIPKIIQEQSENLNSIPELNESVGLDSPKYVLSRVLQARNSKSNTPVLKDEDEDISDNEINNMADDITDWEHIISVYDDDELVMIDSDTGEIVDGDLTEDTGSLNEVLSRAERIMSKIRFARTANKRQRAIRLALKRHSSNAIINTRARKLAVKLMKTKLARGKPLDSLSVPERMRIERIIETRSKLVGRLALKLTSRIRTIEKTRLAHKAVTQ